jgi:hypothetical protein
MTAIFHRFRLWLLPPVSRREAAAIACRHIAPPLDAVRVVDGKPENARIYSPPVEPCWYVHAPWGDGKDGHMLRSSRLMAVSKTSGRVLYDGSACDEG